MQKAMMLLSRKRGYVLLALTLTLALVGGGVHHYGFADPDGW